MNKFQKVKKIITWLKIENFLYHISRNVGIFHFSQRQWSFWPLHRVFYPFIRSLLSSISVTVILSLIVCVLIVSNIYSSLNLSAITAIPTPRLVAAASPVSLLINTHLPKVSRNNRYTHTVYGLTGSAQ